MDRGRYVHPQRSNSASTSRPGSPAPPQAADHRRYRAKIRLHILPRLGHILFGELTARRLNQHYRILETEGSPGGNGQLSLATVRHVHNILSAALTRQNFIRCG